MNNQQKKDAVEIANAKSNVAQRKAEISANPYTPTGKGGKGGVPLTMILSLTDNALADFVVAPRQVQLVLGYIHSLGGTATVQQINEVSVKATGDMTWCRPNGDLYEQTPQKIMLTYITKMKGGTEWNKSNGIRALVS
tara:strand:+ start:247 stop:660 length:414 start_codon:yes stop_codon:yes gene_type:complete